MTHHGLCLLPIGVRAVNQVLVGSLGLKAVHAVLACPAGAAADLAGYPMAEPRLAPYDQFGGCPGN